jgi:transposase
MNKRGKHSKEFKLEAVRLLEEGAKPTTEIALDLGVKRALLYRWRDQLRQDGDDSFSGKTGPKKDQRIEISRLKQELREIKEERDILKKAAAYFARDLK